MLPPRQPTRPDGPGPGQSAAAGQVGEAGEKGGGLLPAPAGPGLFSELLGTGCLWKSGARCLQHLEMAQMTL